jgi:hypothetical protein
MLLNMFYKKPIMFFQSQLILIRIKNDLNLNKTFYNLIIFYYQFQRFR